jgi:hypothetical protein
LSMSAAAVVILVIWFSRPSRMFLANDAISRDQTADNALTLSQLLLSSFVRIGPPSGANLCLSHFGFAIGSAR